MNKVMLVGRLTKDPEVKNTSSQTAFCNFTIAVDRRFKDQNGQRQADFINCVAWRQTASFIGSYFHKGSRIGLVGSLQTRTYDDPASGQKRYVTEVVVDEAEFVESSGNARPQGQGGYPASAPSAPAMPSAPSAPAEIPVQSAPAPQPPQDSVAASAPTAPVADIVSDDMVPGAEADGNGMELPFEL
ncbi:MAG: single-stranded DNA-binding protein [Clostridiales bacterium]|nr:single-stranded DNA-binding protein [Clostridiales bacterium]